MAALGNGFKSTQMYFFSSVYDPDLTKIQIARDTNRAKLVDETRRKDLLDKVRTLKQVLMCVESGVEKANDSTYIEALNSADKPRRVAAPILPPARAVQSSVPDIDLLVLRKSLKEHINSREVQDELSKLSLPVLEPFIHTMSDGNQVVVVVTAAVGPDGTDGSDVEHFGGAINNDNVLGRKDCYANLGKLMVGKNGAPFREVCKVIGKDLRGFVYFSVLRVVDGTEIRLWHSTPNDFDRGQEHREVRVDKSGTVKIVKVRVKK
jgi:hypothetical protein